MSVVMVIRCDADVSATPWGDQSGKCPEVLATRHTSAIPEEMAKHGWLYVSVLGPRPSRHYCPRHHKDREATG